MNQKRSSNNIDSCSPSEVEDLKVLARNIRKAILRITHSAKSSHVGSAFSVVEILVVLYKKIMQVSSLNPEDRTRDRLVFSKGHASLALYVLLAELEFFDKSILADFSKDGSILMSHVSSEVPGIDFSTGSLGHGLPVSVGMALAAQKRGESWKTFVILSDGELNSGSNWEAFMLAPQLKLKNLIVIIDNNKLQAMGFARDIINLEPLDKKLDHFGWETKRVDGHDPQEIHAVLSELIDSRSEKPKLVIADTVKGKGISFMENNPLWHYMPPTDEEYESGIKELS